jgi:hypothetical protein
LAIASTSIDEAKDSLLLKNLQILAIRNAIVTDESLAAIAGHPSLERLAFSPAAISNGGLLSLKSHRAGE